MKNNKSIILYAVIATGITSVTTQLVIIREFLTLFSGNEFVIAITLFNWLVLGGLGSLLARFLENRLHPDLGTLAICSLMLCVAGSIELPIIRYLYKWFFLHGVEVGFYQALFFTASVSAPYCLTVGFLLPFSLFALRQETSNGSSIHVYMSDAIGDATGGAMFSFLLVFFVTPIQAVILSALPLIGVCLYLIYTYADRLANYLFVCFCLILIGMCWLFESGTIERKDSRLVFFKETPYGRVEVQEYKGVKSFIRDGVPLFDINNTNEAEELIHCGLSQRKSIRNVLCISAVAGIFKEIQKYSPQYIDYLEKDPVVASAMFKQGFLQQQQNVRVFHSDPVHYIGNTTLKYDVVIMCIPSPDTFGLNRFFTMEFFRKVKEVLEDDGVLVFSVKGYENYPEQHQLSIFSSLNMTAKRIFKYVTMLPLGKVYYIASEKALSLDIPDLLATRGIKTSYMKTYYLPDLVKFRMNTLKAQLENDAPVNADFSPVIIQHAFGYWFTKMGSSPVLFGVVAAVMFAIYLILLNKTETVLFFTGFSSMGMHMGVILVFQILFGYIYLAIGALITLFLIGLFFGALWCHRFIKLPSYSHLLLNDSAIIAMMVMFLSITALFRDTLPQWALFGFTLLFSLLCGVQFAMGMRIEKDQPGVIAGLFASDLMGAAAGLLIFSLLLIPVIGVFKALMVLCIIKILSLLRYML